MEQAFPATDNTWQSFVWARFRKGEIAFLKRDVSHVLDSAEDEKRDWNAPLTWAEKVNVLLHRVPVYDARFRGCEVTHWRVPFGWIPAQPGDTITFPNSHNVYFS